MGDEVEGAHQFRVDGSASDRFMGRYSRPLARVFADFAEVRPGLDVLDVGCGPGALTAELVARVGAGTVRAVDPSESFVAACRDRHPGVVWDAALAVRPDAPDEAKTLRFGRRGEIATLFDDAGLVEVEEAELAVQSRYDDFDELWDGFLAGVGPAGAFCISLAGDERAAVRDELFARLGEPTGAFTLGAVARAALGRRGGSTDPRRLA